MQTIGHQQQLADQLVGLLITVSGLFGQQFGDDSRDLFVEFGPDQTRIGGRLAAVAQQLLQQRAFGERRTAGQHKIEGAAQRVQVAANVGDARIRACSGEM